MQITAAKLRLAESCWFGVMIGSAVAVSTAAWLAATVFIRDMIRASSPVSVLWWSAVVPLAWIAATPLMGGLLSRLCSRIAVVYTGVFFITTIISVWVWLSTCDFYASRLDLFSSHVGRGRPLLMTIPDSAVLVLLTSGGFLIGWQSRARVAARKQSLMPYACGHCEYCLGGTSSLAVCPECGWDQRDIRDLRLRQARRCVTVGKVTGLLMSIIFLSAIVVDVMQWLY